MSPEVSRRIRSKINCLSDGLTGDVKRLTNFSPEYRLRVGDWRVLFNIDGDMISIEQVRHRSQAYWIEEPMTLKVKPEYLSKRGRREFVVLTVEDFDRMKEALEDAEDLRALRKATARNAKAAYYTPLQMERRLRARSTRKTKAG